MSILRIYTFLDMLRLLASFFLVATALATPFQPIFTSCLSSYPPVAPGTNQLNITTILANLVPGAEASRLGLIGGGANVLRVDLIGVTGSEVEGYDNTTNKLGEQDYSLLGD